MSLKEYNRKRKFDQTPEPAGKAGKREGALRFVIQLHRATRLHYDFRLEMGGSYKSWAVPRGPSLNPTDQRLAVFVEDHPIAYGAFEGIIPRGNYGAGTVMIWDTGTYEERGHLSGPGVSADAAARAGERAMLEGLKKGHITFVLNGTKLQGEFALIRLKDKKNEAERSWLLVKKRDAHSTYKLEPKRVERSAVTERTLEEITAQAESKGEIWLPKRTLTPLQSQRLLKKATSAPRGAQLSSAKATPSTQTRARSTQTQAKHSAMPRRAQPMLARVAREMPPSDAGWIPTPLHGGLRALAEAQGAHVSLRSKRGLDLKRKFVGIADELTTLRLDALLDGEISHDGKHYFVFDLLYANGEDLRALPLTERLARLKRLPLQGRVQLSGSGSKSCAKTLLRRPDSTYRAGVSADWVEAPGALATRPQPPHPPRPQRDKTSRSRATPSRSEPRTRQNVASAPKRPSLAARALMHAARVALPPPPTPREPAHAARAASTARGPTLTHLTKPYWKREGITKGHLIEYYRSVAPYILPHLEGRPMSMHRFPGGIESKGLYQKDLTGYKPRFVRTHRLYSETAGKSIDYVVCDNEQTLLYLANSGCIEMNPWLSRVPHIERPDWLVIDLDPDRQSFEQVVQVALATHKWLERKGIPNYCKTSGATGMHIGVPMGAKGAPKIGTGFDGAREFAQRICEEIQRQFPDLTTLERNPAKRGGRMYLDFMQNRIGQTLASPYSVRPRPGAPVSTPLKWSEVTRKLDPTEFTLHNTLQRLERVGDLWLPLLPPIPR